MSDPRRSADQAGRPGTGALLELETGAIAAGGGCVARADDGRVVFVRHSLPGERVIASITDEARSYVRADAVEVISPSPQRVRPPCPNAGPGRCGGCDWQHVAVPEQRRLKGALVAEQLRRLAGIERSVGVIEVAGAPLGLGWRSRVRFGVDDSGRVGLHKHRSHELQLLDSCPIASAGVEALGVERIEWPATTDLEVFASEPDGGRLLSLTSRSRRLGRLPVLEAGLVVDGRVVRGPERLGFDVMSRHFEVSAGVFWQVHPGATRVLAESVLDGLGAQPGDRVVDLYAGAGLFASLVGNVVGVGGSVLAVERDRWACADAARNTADQPQVKVRKAAVTPGLVAAELDGVDLVVLDPAREGAGRLVMIALAGLAPGPRRIVYVSCDPASFARDLRVMLDSNWTMTSLDAFDLFPMTEHVELVAVIEPDHKRRAP